MSCDLMPHDQTTAFQTRKRRREPALEAESIPDPLPRPSAKRRKPVRQPRHRTPSRFWDNLSWQWLTPRALREFDRRTVRPAVPLPPASSEVEKHHITQLKRFARHGGPSLADLKAYPEPETTAQPIPTMSSSRSGSRRRAESSSAGDNSSRTSTTRKTSTSAYNPGFEQHLIDHGIYPEGYNDVEPSNLDEINERLAQPRPSLSPSRFPHEEFRDFRRKNREALTEANVRSTVFPIIAGNADALPGEDIPFNNLAPLTDGTIAVPRPDFFYGSRPEQLDRRVREEIGPYVTPSTGSAHILPNFFAEGKGPKGRPDVAKRQALQDGAAGERGMLHARSYVNGGVAVYDGSAYTITSTYHSGTGTLTMYTVHPTQPADPDGRPNYHMTQLRSFAVTDTIETFRQGAGAFRNAMDLTERWRDNIITRANEKVNGSQDLVSGPESPSLNLLPSFASEAPSQASATSVDEGPYTSDTVVHESETSTDELALDLRLPAKRSSKHSARSHQSHRKRRNPSGPGSTRRGHTPATISSSRSTAAGNATT